MANGDLGLDAGDSGGIPTGLHDSLSPGVRDIARELNELSRTVRRVSDDIVDSLKQASDRLAGMNTTYVKSGEDVKDIGGTLLGMARQVLAPAGIIGGLAMVTRYFDNMAVSRLHLSNVARDMGATAQSALTMARAFQMSGDTRQQGEQYRASLSAMFKDPWRCRHRYIWRLPIRRCRRCATSVEH
jgi:hypothetical protein